MKRFILPLLILAVTLISGCAGTSSPVTMADTTVAEAQYKAQAACYQAAQQSKPDMSQWTPEQIAQYQLIEKLGDANKLLAKVSLDPCADAAGTNVYDAQVSLAKEGTQRQKNWLDFGQGVATKALYGFIAYEAADSYKTWVKHDDGTSSVITEDTPIYEISPDITY